MSGWAGFTDADLKKIKPEDSAPQNENELYGPQSRFTMKQTPVNLGSRRPATGQKRPGVRKTTPKTAVATPLNQDQMLSKPKPKEQSKPESKPVNDQENLQTGTGSATPPVSTDTGAHHSAAETVTGEEGVKTADEKENMVTDDNEIFKAKKAKAESSKLIDMQKELNKLDQLLTVDVSIIRDKIENACREFFDAQKRYDRAEKEYVESKIDLHHKMEHKDSLMEHLYTVIYQNEMRKSKKLAELMLKLEMEVEVSEVPECDMPHPSLLSPVQLPLGRYGQIGTVKVDPNAAPKAGASSVENSPEKAKDREASADSDKKPSPQESDAKPSPQETDTQTAPQETGTKTVPQETLTETDTKTASEETSSDTKKESSPTTPQELPPSPETRSTPEADKTTVNTTNDSTAKDDVAKSENVESNDSSTCSPT